MMCEKKKKKALCVSVTGVVIAISHIIFNEYPRFYIKLLQSKPLCIRVRSAENFSWLKFLKVGKAYRFSRLVAWALFEEISEDAQFMDALPRSTVQEVMLALPRPVLYLCMSSVSYKGNITDSTLSHLGLYTLDNNAVLCTSFLDHVANVGPFKQRDPVIVYNAHSKIFEGVQYYVMCAKSTAFSQPDSMLDPRNSSVLHPIINFVLENQLNADDFLWLVKIFLKLKDLLNQVLPLGSKIYRKYISDILNHLIFDNGPSVLCDDTVHRPYMKEFMFTPHKCTPLGIQRHPDLQILTAEDCLKSSVGIELGEKFWTYQLQNTMNKKGTKFALIGRLNIDEDIGCLTLSNGSLSVKCLVANASSNITDLMSCINRIVLVRMASVVVERFKLSTVTIESSCEERNVYILLFSDCIHAVGDSFENHTKFSTEPDNDSEFMNIDKTGNNEPMLGSLDADFISQQLVLHHVSTPMIYYAEKQFYCLVSLLGEPMESDSSHDPVEGYPSEKGRLCLLCMKKNMFQYYPLLCENRIYEIRFPKSCGKYVFNKRVNFPSLRSGALFLPCTDGVVIPNGSSLVGPFTSPHLPEDSLLSKEIYGIRDSVMCVERNDVVHLRGVVVCREHQSSQYPRLNKITSRGYGIPEERNIILELRDEEGDETVRIYLIAYGGKLYPLGLVPGSCLCVKFVEKRCSAKKNLFYQSTCFTSIKVLEYPRYLDKSKTEMELDDIKRHSFLAKEIGLSYSSPFWGIFSICKLCNLKITSICRACNSHITHRRCTHVGCSYLLKEPLITADASFQVEDGSGTTSMSAKNEHVRILLGLSESDWKGLGTIACEKELSYNCTREEVFQTLCYTKKRIVDMNQAVFVRFCEEGPPNKPWHVLCRRGVMSAQLPWVNSV